MQGENILLPTQTPTKSRHDFDCWVTVVDGEVFSFEPGQEFRLDADVTLIATWIANCDYFPNEKGGIWKPNGTWIDYGLTAVEAGEKFEWVEEIDYISPYDVAQYYRDLKIAEDAIEKNGQTISTEMNRMLSGDCYEESMVLVLYQMRYGGLADIDRLVINGTLSAAVRYLKKHIQLENATTISALADVIEDQCGAEVNNLGNINILARAESGLRIVRKTAICKDPE